MAQTLANDKDKVLNIMKGKPLCQIMRFTT